MDQRTGCQLNQRGGNPMTDLPTPAPSGDLIALADRINAEHAEVIKSVRQGADHAIRAGKLLLEAKIAVPHGGGRGWVAAQLGVSQRTGQGYMPLVREKPQGISDMTLTAALKQIE